MAFSISNLNSSELSQVNSALKNPENVDNDASVEMHWAMKAMEHADVHYNLITSVDASQLRLTKSDDKIYKLFRESFPDLALGKLVEDELKTPEAKAQWREFCEQFKDDVEDYNQGTLLRLDCEGGYSQENTTLSVRAQFLAIEIARNREGLNSSLLKKKQNDKS